MDGLVELKTFKVQRSTFGERLKNIFVMEPACYLLTADS